VDPLSPSVLAGRTRCAVKLEVFEGPLDLLLHLIRLNEVDISDIPIATITDQYLEYLDLMRELDIDVAAEYLLMAATLAHIKSKMLLPPSEEDQVEEGPDPRAELARRLAEYAAFRDAAAQLGSRALLGRDVFAPTLDPQGIPQKEPEFEVSLFSLLEALRRALQRMPGTPRAHEVVVEEVSIQDRMIHVMDRLRSIPQGVLPFEELLLDAAEIRHYVVMTFLAILELARIQAIRIFQTWGEGDRRFGPIRVRLAVIESSEPASELPRENGNDGGG
jgi:segregation and condensation protein A